MTSITPTMSMIHHDYHMTTESFEVSNKENGNKIEKVGSLIHCFICDVKVVGRYYTLAKCKTQSTRSRVIEKLGELVGERYMVVVSEDDIICRGCANLINTLDRLETEINNVKSCVLKFLEQKYSLEKNELLKNCNQKIIYQPPQITRFNEQMENSNFANLDNSKRANSWMQCNRCKYTTQCNSFMIHHIRNHMKHKISCDNCGIHFPENEQHKCNVQKVKNYAENKINISPVKEQITPMSIPLYSESQILKNESVSLIQFTDSSNEQIQNVLSSEENLEPNEQLFLRVLQSDNEITEISDSEVQENIKKQILTLTEDGNLDVVEMAWNDENLQEGSRINFL